MTTWTQLHPDEATLLKRKFFKEPGDFNFTVPAGASYLRATAVGCGGQGDHWGGSGALARSTVPVTVGDNIKVHVGDVSTATVAGDSSVLRNDNSTICYADRGRGNGNRGLAANSIGDVVRDGNPGSPAGAAIGGAPANDAGDVDPTGMGGYAADVSYAHAADAGGGGHTYYAPDADGNLHFWAAWGAGPGIVCLEFFDTNPGY